LRPGQSSPFWLALLARQLLRRLLRARRTQGGLKHRPLCRRLLLQCHIQLLRQCAGRGLGRAHLLLRGGGRLGGGHTEARE
jgi:hypothetical protein